MTILTQDDVSHQLTARFEDAEGLPWQGSRAVVSRFARAVFAGRDSVAIEDMHLVAGNGLGQGATDLLDQVSVHEVEVTLCALWCARTDTSANVRVLAFQGTVPLLSSTPRTMIPCPRGRWVHQRTTFRTSRFQRTLHLRTTPVCRVDAL